MDLKFEEEDKYITFFCSLHESWDHFVTSTILSINESLEFGSIVGALLSKEVWKNFSIETFALETMVARGWSKERREKARSSSRSK